MNALAAYEAGARRFDAALGRPWRLPVCAGASGNICTEDLVNLWKKWAFTPGIDLPHLLHLSRQLPALLGHELPGQCGQGRAQLRPTSTTGRRVWMEPHLYIASTVEDPAPDNKNNRAPSE